MKNGFPGFSSGAIKFLRGLSKNNDREWFHPRKEAFDTELKAPMVDLVAALQREIETSAPDYLQDPAKCVYRIYRDTRFSKNKTPYKTHLSAALKKQGLGRDGSAVFYFHISPTDTVIAAGCYMPGSDELRALRTQLSESHEEFAKLCRSPKLRSTLGDLQGEQTSRPPKGFDPQHPAIDLLRRKQFYFAKQLNPKIVTTPELFDELARSLKATLPILEYLNRALIGLTKADDSRFLRDSL